jgi:hypothetical protein
MEVRGIMGRRSGFAGRAGFSLIAVLILSVTAMSLLAGMMYMFEAFAGSARVSVNEADVYNTLQSEIEMAKGVLKVEMEGMTDAPRNILG